MSIYSPFNALFMLLTTEISAHRDYFFPLWRSFLSNSFWQFPYFYRTFTVFPSRKFALHLPWHHPNLCSAIFLHTLLMSWNFRQISLFYIFYIWSCQNALPDITQKCCSGRLSIRAANGEAGMNRIPRNICHDWSKYINGAPIQIVCVISCLLRIWTIWHMPWSLYHHL